MKSLSNYLILGIFFIVTPLLAQLEPVELQTYGGESRVYAVNDSGQSVGWVKTADDIDHAVLWDTSGSIVLNLHSLLNSAGIGRSYAMGITRDGYIIGHYLNASGLQRAFIYTPSQGISDLGTLGGNETLVVAINNAGQIIGKSENTQAEWLPYIITPIDTDNDGAPDTWNQLDNSTNINRLMTEMGAAPRGSSWGGKSSPFGPVAVNAQGVVTGVYDQPWGETGFESRGFGWSMETGMVDLGTLGGTEEDATEPHALSDNSVVGYSTINGEVHAFQIKPQPCGNTLQIFCTPTPQPDIDFIMTDLGTLGGPVSIARAVNNHGKVVGESNYLAGGQPRAVLWENDDNNSLPLDLGTLGDENATWSRATAINDMNQVIGISKPAVCPDDDSSCIHVFFWSSATEMLDLPPPVGYTRSEPVAINNTGYIAGNAVYYTFSPTRRHTKAVLWISDTTAPVLYLPIGMTLDATSLDGALVTYKVTAMDDTDPNPAVNCLPASGSQFPIGETVVTCTATDSTGNISAPQSFVITVLGAEEQLLNLIALINQLNAAHGITNSLDAKLQNALKTLETIRQNNHTASCNEIDAFIHEVQAQSGKELTFDQANKMFAISFQIMAVLKCN